MFFREVLEDVTGHWIDSIYPCFLDDVVFDGKPSPRSLYVFGLFLLKAEITSYFRGLEIRGLSSYHESSPYCAIDIRACSVGSCLTYEITCPYS